MARGLAERPPACAEHPHHDAVDHCDECGRRFCGDCLVRGRPQLLCRGCWDTAPEREARAARARHPLYRRLDAMRANRASVVAGSIIVGVLALMALSGAAQVLSPTYRAQVGQAVGAVSAFGAVARAPSAPAAGGGSGVAGMAPARLPTLVLPPCCGAGAMAEQLPGSNGGALIDGVVGPTAPVWRSTPGFTTADLRLKVRNTTLAGRVVFAHSRAAPPETWAKDVEVWISLGDDWGDGTDAVRVGQWTLAQTTDAQAFAFPPARIASARVRILSNYGSADYVSLAEIAVLGAGDGTRTASSSASGPG
jgi:hypothetical protein